VHPTLTIDWGPLHLAASTYRVAVIVAALIVVVGTVLVVIRRGLPIAPALTVVVVGAVGAVVGARLLGALNSGAPLLDGSFRGFAIWGALLGASVAGGLSWRLYRRSPIPGGFVLDAAVVPAGLALGVARTGCLCAGCCFGLPTHLPWGAGYPSGSNAHIASLSSTDLLDRLFEGPPPVHPVPVYDGGAAIIAAGIGWWVDRRLVRTGRLRPGSGGAAFLGTYALARAAIERVRYHPPDPGLFGPLGWQVVFLTVAAACLTWMWAGHRARRFG
jgi:prolipoprotein diacylglyceryltransferase